MLNIPNALTFLRILAVPLFLSLLADGRYQPALIVFALAGLTDALDGAVARLTDTRTELGSYLDPFADKLLLVSAFITLGIIGSIPAPLMITVIVRDVVIMGGYLFAATVMEKAMAMSPTIWGKVTTFTQLVTVALVLVDMAAWLAVPTETLMAAFIITAVATVGSGVHYVAFGLRQYQAES